MSNVTAILDAAVAVITDILSLADSLQALVDAMSENTLAEKPAAKASKPKKIAAKETPAEPASKEE